MPVERAYSQHGLQPHPSRRCLGSPYSSGCVGLTLLWGRPCKRYGVATFESAPARRLLTEMGAFQTRRALGAPPFRTCPGLPPRVRAINDRAPPGVGLALKVQIRWDTRPSSGSRRPRNPEPAPNKPRGCQAPSPTTSQSTRPDREPKIRRRTGAEPGSTAVAPPSPDSRRKALPPKSRPPPLRRARLARSHLALLAYDSAAGCDPGVVRHGRGGHCRGLRTSGLFTACPARCSCASCPVRSADSSARRGKPAAPSWGFSRIT